MRRTFVIFGVVSVSAWQCKSPNESNGPLPPILPDSYHMVYEVNDLVNKTSAFMDVWYDWNNQRARIEQISNNLGIVSLNMYANNAAFNYMEPKPGFSEEKDIDRDFLCKFESLDNKKTTDFLDKNGTPLRMVDIYQALLFGGKYRYAFLKQDADESSRFIRTNRFTSCIKDRVSGKLLNVTYHWTTDKPRPVACEIHGGFLSPNGTLEQEIHQILSIITFERDPIVGEDTFRIPRHINCQDDPRVKSETSFPLLTNDIAWREENYHYEINENAEPLHGRSRQTYREVWISKTLNLARLDWTPSGEEPTFLNYTNVPIKVIADIDHRALFIMKEITGECQIIPLTKDFPLVESADGEDFKFKTPLELLGMTAPHVYKGMYNERGMRVGVYSRTDEFDDDINRGIKIHETTFRLDEELAERTNGALQWIPVSQLKKTRFSDPIPDEGITVAEVVEETAYFRVLQDSAHLNLYEAPGCMSHHERRFFRLSFPGNFSEIILANGEEYLNRVRFMINRAGNLGTLMRVQQLEFYEDNNADKVIVKMTLLEPLPEIPNNLKVTIDEAKAKIDDALVRRDLSVPIEWKGESNIMVPDVGSFKEFTLDGKILEQTTYVGDTFVAFIHVGTQDLQPLGIYAIVGLCASVFAIGLIVGLLIVAVKIQRQRHHVNQQEMSMSL